MKNFITTLIFLMIISVSVFGEPIEKSDARYIDGQALVFGVVPQQAPSKLLRTWTQLRDFISKDSGFELRFATARDIPTFEKRLRDGQYDIAYMNPYHFTIYNDAEAKYLALAKAEGKKIQGIIVVRNDANLHRFSSLDGRDIAFPAPAAFAATLLPQTHLRERGLSFNSHYVSSHDSVYKAVAAGIYPAGGGVMRTLGLIDKETAKQLKVLWASPKYTPHAIAVGDWIPTNVREALLNAFLRVSSSTSASAILSPLNMKGFVEAKDSDWDDVRGLRIDRNLGAE